jgi:hypothetical protein
MDGAYRALAELRNEQDVYAFETQAYDRLLDRAHHARHNYS